ncbi:hypothetical protein ACIBG7_43060 [Nonomuraea sp. NPDC050328]|uniref:hypothetical protein n=1 Tax=Nonomuraea sp. NPDC050328 TaxID=3364361 RepID=UPI0037B42AAA
MALTVKEAHAVNDLLSWILRTPRVTSGRAQLAAEVLAARAHRAMGSGLTPADVQERWRLARTAAAKTGEPSCALCGCTENAACEGGCAWHPNPLKVDVCTGCVETLLADLIREREADLAATLATIERAVGEPGGTTGRPAQHVTPEEAEALGELFERLGPPPAFTEALGTARLPRED